MGNLFMLRLLLGVFMFAMAAPLAMAAAVLPLPRPSLALPGASSLALPGSSPLVLPGPSASGVVAAAAATTAARSALLAPRDPQLVYDFSMLESAWSAEGAQPSRVFRLDACKYCMPHDWNCMISCTHGRNSRLNTGRVAAPEKRSSPAPSVVAPLQERCPACYRGGASPDQFCVLACERAAQIRELTGKKTTLEKKRQQQQETASESMVPSSPLYNGPMRMITPPPKRAVAVERPTPSSTPGIKERCWHCYQRVPADRACINGCLVAERQQAAASRSMQSQDEERSIALFDAVTRTAILGPLRERCAMCYPHPSFSDHACLAECERKEMERLHSAAFSPKTTETVTLTLTSDDPWYSKTVLTLTHTWTSAAWEASASANLPPDVVRCPHCHKGQSEKHSKLCQDACEARLKRESASKGMSTPRATSTTQSSAKAKPSMSPDEEKMEVVRTKCFGDRWNGDRHRYPCWSFLKAYHTKNCGTMDHWRYRPECHFIVESEVRKWDLEALKKHLDQEEVDQFGNPVTKRSEEKEAVVDKLLPSSSPRSKSREGHHFFDRVFGHKHDAPPPPAKPTATLRNKHHLEEVPVFRRPLIHVPAAPSLPPPSSFLGNILKDSSDQTDEEKADQVSDGFMWFFVGLSSVLGFIGLFWLLASLIQRYSPECWCCCFRRRKGKGSPSRRNRRNGNGNGGDGDDDDDDHGHRMHRLAPLRKVSAPSTSTPGSATPPPPYPQQGAGRLDAALSTPPSPVDPWSSPYAHNPYAYPASSGPCPTPFLSRAASLRGNSRRSATAGGPITVRTTTSGLPLRTASTMPTMPASGQKKAMGGSSVLFESKQADDAGFEEVSLADGEVREEGKRRKPRSKRESLRHKVLESLVARKRSETAEF